MIDGIRKRLRPGSKGEALSKVDTTGRAVAQQAAELRIRNGQSVDVGITNWPVGLMSKERTTGKDVPAEAIPRHAPDDTAVVNRLFRLGISDI